MKQEFLENQSKLQKLSQILSKSLETIFKKSQDSYNQWTSKYNQMDLQQQMPIANKSETQITNQKQIIKKPALPRKQNGKLKITVSATPKSKPNVQISSKQEAALPSKQTQAPNFRTRTKSQNTYLKSLKKTNELTNQKQQEEKKNLRIKQITKRKIQLMDRLKKIDAQLMQVKRESSPPPQQILKDDRNLLYQSNLNRSFINNIHLSRLNKQASENIAEQHSKALQMLQKINNQKIKRQQRLAQQFRKKQSSELRKLEQIQKKKNQDLQNKKLRAQPNLSKTSKSNKSKLINQTKINQFVQNQSQLIPTTIIHKQKKQLNLINENQFFDEQKRNTRMFTQRDIQDEQQNIQKQNDKSNRQFKSAFESVHSFQSVQGTQKLSIENIENSIINQSQKKLQVSN